PLEHGSVTATDGTTRPGAILLFLLFFLSTAIIPPPLLEHGLCKSDGWHD
ncbi:hypothetical protein T492DRAFT_919007, partial [Pavlovales sp. CCMP2436]